jgi:hypothetical protein
MTSVIAEGTLAAASADGFGTTYLNTSNTATAEKTTPRQIVLDVKSIFSCIEPL